ncbi:MAG: restriction endonuclease subunit R [Oscillatoriales cyanobacterium]|nr:MAG: restriction endonuclease subunit R [Oscillatoriales cyanobacterium]
MANVIDASALALPEVIDRLQLQIQFEADFRPSLDLQTLSAYEIQQIAELRQNWQRYYLQGKISENQVQVAALSPLLWMSGYLSDPTLQISMEEVIDEIAIEDGDTVIRGRMDLWVGRQLIGDRVPLCVLIVEAKNSAISPAAGLPQLLTYAGTVLERQDVVWGLVSNGLDYVFVRLEGCICRHFRNLNILTADDAEQLLAVMIAIRQ